MRRVPRVCAVVAIAIASVASQAGSYVETDGVSVSLSTHQFIFWQAFEILGNDGYPELSGYISAELFANLAMGSVRADETLWDSREHYHHPDSHEGFLDFRSAGELCQEHWNNAIQYWDAGNRYAAAYELGWATHAVADLTVPHHATLTPFDEHSEYEGWVNDHKLDFTVNNNGIYAFDGDLPGHYSDEGNPSHWVDYNAHEAIDWFSYVNGGGDDDFRLAASILMQRAQRTTAGFFLQFFQTVNDPPMAEILAAPTAYVGEATQFDAGGSSDDLGIGEIVWDFGDGTQTTGTQASHIYMEAGRFSVTVFVRDWLGVETVASVEIEVLAYGPPVAVIEGPVVAALGSEVVLDASMSVVTGPSPSFVWMENGATVGTGQVIVLQADTPGTRVITLEVTDFRGRTGHASHVFTVVSECPDLYVPQMQVLEGEPIVLEVPAEYVQDGIRYIWVVNGEIYEGESVTIENLTPAGYTLTLLTFGNVCHQRFTSSILVLPS
jgi:phospholipase C